MTRRKATTPASGLPEWVLRWNPADWQVMATDELPETWQWCVTCADEAGENCEAYDHDVEVEELPKRPPNEQLHPGYRRWRDARDAWLEENGVSKVNWIEARRRKVVD